MASGVAKLQFTSLANDKEIFLMLALIIPKEFCTSTNVDVYLQPLIEELQVLSKGVDAFYAYLGANFNFKTMCIWSIHDFLAYHLFVGCVT
jgi:hypothetical protein